MGSCIAVCRALGGGSAARAADALFAGAADLIPAIGDQAELLAAVVHAHLPGGAGEGARIVVAACAEQAGQGQRRGAGQQNTGIPDSGARSHDAGGE